MNLGGELGMGSRSIFVLGEIIALASGCTSKTDEPEETAKIKTMVEEWARAETAGDAAALSDQYAADAVVMAPNEPLFVGKDAIHSALRTYFEKHSQHAEATVWDIRIVGDLAFSRGSYATKSTPNVPGEATIALKGSWFAVYCRQQGGSWKMTVNITDRYIPVAEAQSPVSTEGCALLQVERDWAAAWRRHDVEALDGILADDYVENKQGQIITKATMLADLRAGVYKIESVAQENMRALVFGSHGVVNGNTVSRYTVRGRDASEKTQWTDIFEGRAGRWRAVASYSHKVE
jgi:uncharacterized protein (TIGR02246 family)